VINGMQLLWNFDCVFGSNLPFFVQLMLLFCWHHKKVPLIGQLSF
jgi:hypothetical protein